VSAETQIRGFLSKYSPALAGALRAARKQLRAHFPRGHELVFDNYNALVFAFSPTDRASEAFISVAGYPRWVTLFFLRGVELRDPQGILEGSGKQIRSIRLGPERKLSDAAVQDLIAQAIDPHRAALARAEPLRTLVKTVVAQQRARRPAAKK
jgi:hypothetical protein